MDFKERFYLKLDHFLKEKDLKQTKQRLTIVDYLIGCKDHIDAESLHREVSKLDKSIGMATVYRTLKLLKEANLIDELKFVEGKAAYEVIDLDNHHDHMICTQCDDVFEFHNEEIEALQLRIAESFRFKLLHHRLDMFGICQNCQKEDKQEGQ